MSPFLMPCMLVLFVTLSACEAEPETPARQRAQAFKSMLKEYEALGLVVRDVKPYEAIAFAQLATTYNTSAQTPFLHFTVPDLEQTGRSKPEVWTQAARFNQARDAYLTEVAAFAQEAQGGDFSTIKARYQTLGQHCKSCHDVFRYPN
jgi:cytochrome c556